MKSDHDLFLVAGLTFITVLLWIVFEFTKTTTTSTVTARTKQLTQPLTPVLDSDTLDKIEQKKIY